MPRDDKVAILKDSLAAIGRRIEHVLNAKEAQGEDRDRWRRHLWTYVAMFLSGHEQILEALSPHRFVTLFWPKKVKASKLEEIHAKMVMKEAAPRQPTDTNVSKKQRTSTGPKTNGSSGSAPASASVRANGKSHR